MKHVILAAVAALGLAGAAQAAADPKVAHADYAGESIWRVMADQDLTRAIRATGGAALALLLFGVWRLFAMPATPQVVGDDDPDFDRVRAILRAAEWAQPDSNLALLGDKRFLFSPSGETFLMFGVRGRSWIAMDGPVGRLSERMELLWRFRELADAHAARPALYGIGPEDLPDCVELGFSIIANQAAGVVDQRLHHEDVTRAANSASHALAKLVFEVIRRLPRATEGA